MNIKNISNLNFNAFILPMSPVVYNTPAPAIIRSISTVENKAAQETDTFIKSALLQSNPMRKLFSLHEAIVTDPKVRVIGLQNKARQAYTQTKLKGAGRKQNSSIWLRR